MLLKLFAWLAVIYISGLNYQCEALFGLGTAAVIGAYVQTKSLQIKTNSIYFKLWTKNNLDAEIKVFNTTSLTNFENFSHKRKTVVLIHGRMESAPRGYARRYFQVLASAFLKKGDYNVIGVDWDKLRYPESRFLGARNAEFVGKHAALFLLMLTLRTGASYEIVAHEYGVIAANVIGTFLKGKVIQKITALAPQEVGRGVLPLYKYPSRSIAPVVQVIHTYGHTSNMGHHDVYLNGGEGYQPGCSNDRQGVCSITKAFEYYAIAVYTKGVYYRTTLCSSYQSYLSGRCHKNPRMPLYNQETSKTKPIGKYYLKIGEPSPKLLRRLNIISQEF